MRPSLAKSEKIKLQNTGNDVMSRIRLRVACSTIRKLHHFGSTAPPAHSRTDAFSVIVVLDGEVGYHRFAKQPRSIKEIYLQVVEENAWKITKITI